jgi:1,4-dihydroxy-2-naphthoyl-CoA hydrolase
MDHGQADASGRDALGELLGFEHLEGGKDLARARVPVRADLLHPGGLVHGGVFAALAETVTSKATHEAVTGDGMAALGQSNHVTFIRAVASGHINAEARLRHHGRTSWVWEVEMTDDEGRLCALAVTIVAVRPTRRREAGSA